MNILLFKQKIRRVEVFLLLIAVLGISSCTPSTQQQRTKVYNVKKPVSKKSYKSQTVKKIETEKKLDRFVEKYWGAKYRLGATGPKSFDCSGFVQRIFKEAYGYSLPRVSREQYKRGTKVSKKYLKYGDLVFFDMSGRKRRVSHVGVYIGNNRFAHASTSKGVTISSLRNSYYKKRYLGARRVL